MCGVNTINLYIVNIAKLYSVYTAKLYIVNFAKFYSVNIAKLSFLESLPYRLTKRQNYIIGTGGLGTMPFVTQETE